MIRLPVLIGLSLLLARAALAQGSFYNWETPPVHPLDMTPDGTKLVLTNTADARLEVRDIDPPEDPRVGGLAEAAPPGEPEEPQEVPAPLPAVIDEGLVAGHAREHGDDRQAEQGGQRVPLAPGPARIVNAPEQFHQRGAGIHA